MRSELLAREVDEHPMGPKTKGVRLKAANGVELKYYGTKKVRFHPIEGHTRGGARADDARDLNFHVTCATKSLAAAMAIAKMGNRTILEEGPGKSYAESLKTGDKVMLRESGEGQLTRSTSTACRAPCRRFSAGGGDLG